MYGGFICIATAYAAFEVRGMLRTGGYAPVDLALFGVAVALPLDAWLRPDARSLSTDGLPLLIVLVILSLVTLLIRPTSARALVDCDSSAFFVGGAIGRTPLAPNISPKKSVEGAIAGLLGAAITGPLLGLPFGLPPLIMAGYGLAIGLATVVGDLIESLIKRQTGVKDSGVLIPGHGGLLDRMDSLLVCAPVAVLYLHAVGA